MKPFNKKEYNECFNELYVPLCRYCMKFTGDKEAAEDIVQEQFVYLWENIKKFENFGSIKAYMYTSVKNRSLNYIKRQLKFNNNIDESFDIIDKNSNSTPSEILEGKEIEKIFELALGSLPEKFRAIFAMKKFGEMTNKEIANELNISNKTVESQITIAFKKLNSFLLKYQFIIFTVIYLKMIG